MSSVFPKGRLVHWDTLETLIQFMLYARVLFLTPFYLGPLVKAGVSVIRVSGSQAFECIKKMTPTQLPFPHYRKASVRSILDCESKEIIDKGMVICFQEGSR